MFRWIEGDGGLELELESESEEGVFIDALEAMREVLEEDTDAGAGNDASYSVEATGPDRAAQLAGWLRELAALAEADGFVPQRITSLDLGDGSVSAAVEGTCGDPAQLVRGVADHGLVYEPAAGSHRVHARLVLETQRS